MDKQLKQSYEVKAGGTVFLKKDGTPDVEAQKAYDEDMKKRAEGPKAETKPTPSTVRKQ